MSKNLFHNPAFGLILIGLLTFASATCLISCGDTGTDGNTKSNWVINGVLAHNGETGFVNVYFELTKDDEPYISAILKVDGQSVQSNANGTYTATLDPDLLADTSEIAISTPIDQFQFKYLIAVPDSFSFDFDQLPGNQVFAATNVVNVRWNASNFRGYPGGYFIVTKPASSANPASGEFGLFSGQPGTISRDAFRTTQGDYQTGNYNVWVVARVAEPFTIPALPFTIPEGVFVPNVDRVGVTGQIGALYISPRKVITAVVGI